MIYKQVFNMVNTGIIILNKDLTINQWNHWMENHSGRKNSSVVGLSIFEIAPNLDLPWFTRSCKAALSFGTFSYLSYKKHEYIIPLKIMNNVDTTFDKMPQNSTLGPLRDENGTIEYLFFTIQDMTEVASIEARLNEMNLTDCLTGAYNRRYLEDRFAAEISRNSRHERDLSLIILDIDFFKSINDTYGHQAGDFVLQQFSDLVQSRIRPSDTFVRYGGEEFCCILPETSLENAAILAEHLRSNVEDEAFVFDKHEINFTISQGIACMKTKNEPMEEILKRADEALYNAKNTGRNKVVLANGFT